MDTPDKEHPSHEIDQGQHPGNVTPPAFPTVNNVQASKTTD